MEDNIKQYYVISPTFIRGKFVEKGAIIDLDESVAEHLEHKGMLESANRIRPASPAEIEASKPQPTPEVKVKSGKGS